MFPVQVVTLLISSEPNKETDTPMTGSHKVLFWYERTLTFLHFFSQIQSVESTSEFR